MYEVLGKFSWEQIHSWNELEVAIAALDTERDRGEAFEEFCFAYIRLESDLYQVKDHWRFRDAPRDVLDQLSLVTAQDRGVDGIILHHDSTLTAYQAKFRVDRAATPSQRELATFYMVSDRADYRLVIANVHDLPSVVKERKDHGQVLVDQLLSLDRTFFIRLAELVVSGVAIAQEAIPPRSYQAEALQAIVQGFSGANRGQAILACGAGKTLIGKWVLDRLGCKSALVMVPSLALIRQTLGEWFHANSGVFEYLCVCSDPTVDSRTEDSWVTHDSDLDCRVTTDPVVVANYLGMESHAARIIFSTYQSGEVIAAALRESALSDFQFDLAICDEAHRLTGTSDKVFTHVLYDSSIRIRKRLFMTATPRIVEPILKSEVRASDEVAVLSMDDAEIFGTVFHRFGFRQAIEQKVICEYQIVVIGVSEEEASIFAPNSQSVTTLDAGRWNLEGLAQRIALGKAISAYHIKKIFSFHNRVDSASRFVDKRLPESFPSLMKQLVPDLDFVASHIAGDMAAGVRAKILNEFRSAARGVISNARCLGEGVNVPDVDGIFFSDPRKSVIEIVQATGRALRRREDKQTAFVIIPVLMRTGEDPESLLRSSRFDCVWQVLSAMMSQDERALEATIKTLIAKGEEVDGESKAWRQIKGKALPDLHSVLLGFPMDLPLSEYQRLFSLEAVERVGERWYIRFGMLKRYMREYGKEPTSQTEFRGVRLGSWLASQRAAFRKNSLDSDRKALLNGIGVALAKADHIDRTQLSWEKHLAACRAFVDVNGRLPGEKDVDPAGNKLGYWLAHQRARYRTGRLPQDKISQIEQVLDVVWEPQADKWNRNFSAYKNYVERYGKQPGKRSVHNGLNIGNWVISLRQQQDKLTDEKITALNALGMVWSERAIRRKRFALQDDDQWLAYYVLFKQVIFSDDPKSTSDEIKDAAHKFSENALGEWFELQQREYRNGKLPEKRRRHIRNLGHLLLTAQDKYLQDHLLVPRELWSELAAIRGSRRKAIEFARTILGYASRPDHS